mmetsp:Transcript_16466/g.33598  ORF Transcript_16466/g.33598 Transcript_16466/m.33598 type:complete len:82 (-) Transcript_16466:1269-1514(-)
MGNSHHDPTVHPTVGNSDLKNEWPDVLDWLVSFGQTVEFHESFLVLLGYLSSDRKPQGGVGGGGCRDGRQVVGIHIGRIGS